MCGDKAVITAAVEELQDAELAAFLRRIFASERWAIIRAANPGLGDTSILHRMVGYEALRCAIGNGPPVEFYASEFERCK